MTETKPMLPFPAAIKSCLRQYAEFDGRATRSEYWWWVLGFVVVIILLFGVDWFIFEFIFGFKDDIRGLLTSSFGLVTLMPWLAVTTRRLHDTDHTGWWPLVWVGMVAGIYVGVYLIGTSTIGQAVIVLVYLGTFIWWIVWMTKRGTAGPNRFGPDPLA